MKKCIFGIFLMFYSLISISGDLQRYYLIAGNPGTGKSTIINSLIDEVKAQSGISFSYGLTEKYEVYDDEGRSFIDTPGLSDVDNREHAIEEIEKALLLRPEKILFVMTLESGRLRNADIETMRTVLEMAPKNTEFGIIINKVAPKEKEKLEDIDTVFAIITQQLFHIPSFISIIGMDRGAQDVDNVLLKNDTDLSELKKNIFNSGFMSPDPNTEEEFEPNIPTVPAGAPEHDPQVMSVVNRAIGIIYSGGDLMKKFKEINGDDNFRGQMIYVLNNEVLRGQAIDIINNLNDPNFPAKQVLYVLTNDECTNLAITAFDNSNWLLLTRIPAALRLKSIIDNIQ